MAQGSSDATRAYRRWQIAKVIRDGQWRHVDEISKAVGFSALVALKGELRGAKNFERVGDKWRMKAIAIKVLDAREAKPRHIGPAVKKRRKKPSLKKTQRKFF